MFTKGIKFKNFKTRQNTSKISKEIEKLIHKKSQIIESLSKNYKYNFSKKKLKKFKKLSNFRIIGMGGSTLGTEAIYDFLKIKFKKNFVFVDNLQNNQKKKINRKIVNLVISKSGNTIETIVNSNILIKNNNKNIFITENKKSYLYLLAQKLKSEIIHHNNFIGGRYSVLSEVGMVPAELMGLKIKDFKQLNSLIKNKIFFDNLISNVGSTLYFIKKRNSIQ